MAAVLTALVALLLVLVGAAPSAFAHDTPPPLGGPGPNPGPTGGSNGGSSGDPQTGTSDNCSLYASSTSYGLDCFTGGSGGGRTIRQILGKEPLPDCWDIKIPTDELGVKYPSYEPVQDETYYTETCINGLDETRSPSQQTNITISQFVLPINDLGTPCYNYDETNQKANPFNQQQYDGSCILSLTQKQQQVVSQTNELDGQIPGIEIAPNPIQVRTNHETTFVDSAAIDDHGNPLTRTPPVTYGTVTIWATLDQFTIQPFGTDTTPKIACNPAASSGPGSCTYTYQQASADQPGGVYPFRADAHWSVHYEGGDHVEHTLANFDKYSIVHLPVYDVQTLNIEPSPSAP